MGAVIGACEIDARTGGGYRITFGDGGSSGFRDVLPAGTLEVAPPSRMVWTNEESDDGPVTTVTFEEELTAGGRCWSSARTPRIAPPSLSPTPSPGGCQGDDS